MLALSTAAIVSTLVATEPVAGITAETVKAELARPRVSDLVARPLVACAAWGEKCFRASPARPLGRRAI